MKTSGKVFAVPYAGASSLVYRSWKEWGNGAWRIEPLELPGRGLLANQPLDASLDNVSRAIATSILPHALAGDKYVLFGHSYGALLAYATALHLERAGAPPPTKIYVSGATPPSRSSNRGRHQMNATEFRSYIEDYCGYEAAVLDDPVAYQFFSDILRNDIKAVETHQWTDDILSVPIEVIFSRCDPVVNYAYMHEWNDFTSSHFTMTEVSAKDHLYLESHRHEILSLFDRDLLIVD